MKLKSILSRSVGRALVPIVPAALLASAVATHAADAAAVQEPPPAITLKNGRFDPSELVVPANTAFRLQVTNGHAEAIEFESFEVHRERVVKPGETITVFMPSLSPGTYKFFDDFHGSTPNGVIVAK